MTKAEQIANAINDLKKIESFSKISNCIIDDSNYHDTDLLVDVIREGISTIKLKAIVKLRNLGIEL